MPPRDQPFSDRASVFWGHHRLRVEQLARIAGQGQLGLERRDALVGGRQFIGLNAGDALDDSGVDEGLAFPAEQGRLADTGLGCDIGHGFI
ncbi:hypothetical protein MELE44368_02800 [Mycolicibacterium elephantis DSM 44368]|uniref:Uncharacterized protein n=1 Tax=Mycolicibacterium elephantis DSM 44368 TaxID=1335622 RepID=A0A439DV76_9MYCO|nr:hypothetical protein MELE44368_02800 [Mycolicibacterium elephantis DSM 44368]